MGVPGFFGWILRNFKHNIILYQLRQNIEYLYIDANCLFHPVCLQTLEEYINNTNSNNYNINNLEDLMIQNIIIYLDKIEKLIKPTKLMYISVDGVVPMAKIVQQRKRRFKSEYELNIRNKIKAKHNIKTNTLWSNVNISVGTIFMEKLHNKLFEYYQSKSIKSKIKYIYSSYHTYGEGEHKIMNHIKNNVFDNKANIIIYGLDADLIFLSMSLNRDNIYLLRESNQFDQNNFSNYNNHEFVYVSIDETIMAYNKQIFGMNNIFNNYINDLIFVAFFVGNDFLPHYPYLDFSQNGLDMIISIYASCFKLTKVNLIDIETKRINKSILQLMLLELKDIENDFFSNMIFNSQKQNNFRCKSTNPYDIDIFSYENILTVKYLDLELTDTKKEWRIKYYYSCFSELKLIDHKDIDKFEEFIDNIIKLYLEGLEWVLKYYFDECKSYRWNYPYDYPPLISDIYDYIQKYDYEFNKWNNAINNDINIFSQLLAITPRTQYEILPKSYQKLIIEYSEIIDLYPKEFEIDTLFKSKQYKCNPKIPILNIDRIINTTIKLKLTSEEKKRNKNIEDILFER